MPHAIYDPRGHAGGMPFPPLKYPWNPDMSASDLRQAKVATDMPPRHSLTFNSQHFQKILVMPPYFLINPYPSCHPCSVLLTLRKGRSGVVYLPGFPRKAWEQYHSSVTFLSFSPGNLRLKKLKKVTLISFRIRRGQEHLFFISLSHTSFKPVRRGWPSRGKGPSLFLKGY